MGDGHAVNDRVELTRRQALQVGVGAAATLALASCSSGTDDPSGPFVQRQVVVVGAGLAGLTCALDLVARGWDVTVLEARDRVGGRVHTVRDPFSDGLHAEAGGESIDVDHHDLLAMIRRFGLQTEDRPKDKILDGVTSFAGVRRRTKDFVGLRDGKVAGDYARFYAELERVADGIDPAHPETFARAAELDGTTAAAFVDGLGLVPEARFLVETDLRSEFNTAPDRVSMLFLAQQTAVGSDVSDDGVEAMRIHGGNDQLPLAMAKRLGRRVVLGAPVTRIEQTRDGNGGRGVAVRAGARTFHGAWAVLACPLPPLRSVEFVPALPNAVQATIDHVGLGEAAKVTLQYRSRFWERAGWSGFTVSDQPFGVAWSPSDSYRSTQGLLTAFITGDAAAAAAKRSDADRIAEVRSQFDRIYPEGATLHDGDHQSTIAWADERYTGGGYGVWRPGQMVEGWPVLREGTGRLRFAGEQTEELAGYMESAVRSGHRVAKALPDPPRRPH